MCILPDYFTKGIAFEVGGFLLRAECFATLWMEILPGKLEADENSSVHSWPSGCLFKCIVSEVIAQICT